MNDFCKRVTALTGYECRPEPARKDCYRIDGNGRTVAFLATPDAMSQFDILYKRVITPALKILGEKLAAADEA